MNARNSLAMAVLLATASFSSVVAASEVKMYGQIDNAIAYTKAEGENGKVTMDPSVDIPSKWGIMGREDLGNGNYVRFNLEQGFAPDAGTMTWSDRIFGREALVMIGGNWGELALGRTGTFFGSIGTYGQWAKMGINPMQTNYSDATLGGVFTATGMASNSITYQVKPIDTLTLTAQYVNGDHEDYEWSQDDHLYQLAAFYKNADLSVGLIYAMTQYGHLVRYGLDLLELMGDEDDRELIRHVLQERDKLIGLLRRERARGLIEDEEPCAEAERLHELHPLLLAD